jgi:hypothetical protein
MYIYIYRHSVYVSYTWMRYIYIYMTNCLIPGAPGTPVANPVASVYPELVILLCQDVSGQHV